MSLSKCGKPLFLQEGRQRSGWWQQLSCPWSPTDSSYSPLLYKAVQSISVQRQGCTVYNVQRHKGLVKSPEVLTETHFLQATGLNADMCSLLYEKLSWCSVRDDASRNEPKVFFPTQHLPEAQDAVFSSQKDKEDCSFSVIHAPSMTATCRITFSVCFGFTFPGPDLQKY